MNRKLRLVGLAGCTGGTFTNGTYKGEATVKGEQVGIWRELLRPPAECARILA